ncbi:MAG: hypothetical protein Q8L39_01800 [Burkholderiales bacterium]|nr:hypothetical protein [Burkholderiales bacterium]
MAWSLQAAAAPEFGCVNQLEVSASKGERALALAAALRGDAAAGAPALAKLAEQNPADIVVQRCLGIALIGLAAGASDAEKGEEYYRRGRIAFQKAREFGDTHIITTFGLEITEKPYTFDASPLAAIMREGEAAFARADFRAATHHYQRAILLAPNLYEAALFSGDAYYQLKEWDAAGLWFGKAIAIDPARETAYRYWGDALMVEGKRAEARDKFIAAIIAEPYNRTAYKGLGHWAQHYGARLEAPHIQIPVQAEAKAISVDDTRITPYWIAYGIARAVPKKEGNALQHEVEALQASLQVARELGMTSAEKDISLANLMRLEKKGLLEAYVLFHRATKEIAAQYHAYRAANRDALQRYWLEEVIK